VNTGDIGGILVWCILDSCYTCIRESKPRQWSTLDFFSDWHNDDRPRKRQLWTPPVGNLPGLLPHWYLSHSNYGCRRLGICLSFLSWLDDLFAPMDASGSESIPQQCLRPDSPRSTTQGRYLSPSGLKESTTPRECLRPDVPSSLPAAEGRCPGLAADGVWQLVPVPCADCQCPCNDEMATRNRHE
jgi:hypothetical protein